MKDFSLNRVMIAGVVSTTPKLTVISSDHSVCSFEVTTLSIRGKKEIFQHHRAFAYGKRGTRIHDNVKLGSPVWIEGELVYRDVPQKDGAVYRQAEVNVFTVRPLPYALDSGVLDLAQHFSPEAYDDGEPNFNY